MGNVKKLLGDKIEFGETQYDCLNKADALVIATEWNEFRTPDFLKIVKLMKNKVIFDGRYLFDTDAIKELGFFYESVGRATAIPTNGTYHK
jgi:UDPglucose 6-dehydrogenase